MTMHSELPDDEHAEKPGRLGDNIGSVEEAQRDVDYVENDDVLEPMAVPLEGDAEDYVWVDEFGDAFVAEVGGAPPQARVGDEEPEG